MLRPRGHCSTAPRVPIGVPRVFEPVATKIRTDVRERRRDLDPAVRQHEQRGWRTRETGGERVADLERFIAELHLAREALRLAIEQRAKARPIGLGALEPIPLARGGAEAHESAGV